MTTIATDEQILHSAFSKNLVTLDSARRKINRQINMALRKDDSHSVMIFTNMYLLIYTSWSEAALVKLVHTHATNAVYTVKKGPPPFFLH